MMLSATPHSWRRRLPVARIAFKLVVSHAFEPGVLSFFRWLIWLRRAACSPATLVGSAGSVSFSGCMAELAPMAAQAPLAPLPPLPPPAVLVPLGLQARMHVLVLPVQTRAPPAGPAGSVGCVCSDAAASSAGSASSVGTSVAGSGSAGTAGRTGSVGWASYC